MELVKSALLFFDAIIFLYFGLYCVVNTVLLAVSFFSVRRDLERSQLQVGEAIDRSQRDAFSPLLSLIVPAYNEEVTIVDSVRSLLRLDYPAYEVIMVNDGSKDRTVEVLKSAFQLVRNDVDYHPLLGAQPVKGFYRTTIELPKQVVRLVLVDKENGGKADAINAGINASQGSYVATMDADSLMIKDALHAIVQPILDDPNRVLAVGGSIALSNGCKVQDGKIIEVALPKTWIARFQVVEYMRSFIQSRTALGQLNSILILSGVFAVFQRQALVAIGGFLTKHMRSKVGIEYCGAGSETVCEDMEVVVRMHRYAKDHGLEARICFIPLPTSWTEAPEIYLSLGKQRNRWYRGLLEVLVLHRKMMGNPKYGRVGVFSLPYQLLFEGLAPILEASGYLLLPISYLVGILSLEALVAFTLFALMFNFFLSVGSVLVAIFRVRVHNKTSPVAMFDYHGFYTLLVLTMAGFLSNLGYRQFLVYWQLRGLKDFLAGKKSWDKFARQGFAPTAGAAPAVDPKPPGPLA